MGGDRETFLEAGEGAKDKGKGVPAGAVAGTIGSVTGQRLRIHQSGGEIHVHEDTSKLKCVIPVAEAWKGWEQIRCQPGLFEWIDTVNNSYLSLQTNANPPNVQLSVNLIAINPDPNFKEFNNFIKRK